MKNLQKQQAELYQELFNFLIEEHNLICTSQEMDEIIIQSLKCIKKINRANIIMQEKTSIYNPKCDDVCKFYCTKGGTQLPECIH